ncbi:MAG: hypothetical protein ABI706_05720 [Ilumatobacteraceae bacterium]
MNTRTMKVTWMALAALSMPLLAGTASAGGAARQPKPVPAVAASLAKVAVNPTDVVGGAQATGTVTLTSPAAAGGFLVALSSDDPAAATVPASVVVPAGSTSATFVVSTTAVTNTQSSLIIGTAGTVTTYAIITVYTQSAFSQGSVSIIPGNNGSGTITSQPAGINCVIVNGSGSGAGACSSFFPAGTVVRLTASAATGSKFQGWRSLPGCSDPSRIIVSRNSNISCQPAFSLK